jgi:hypothetical protein
VLLAALFVIVHGGSAYGMGIYTPTQQQLFDAEDITSEFGGNGQVLSRSLDGAGVRYEIQGGTIDFGKVALRIEGQQDLSDFNAYGLHIEILTAANSVEINPYIQTGDQGQDFFEDEPGVKSQGDAFDSYVSFAGIPNIDDVFGVGFQYFTAGDVGAPTEQIVLIRITPIPEPSTATLIAIGISCLALTRRDPLRD